MSMLVVFEFIGFFYAKRVFRCRHNFVKHKSVNVLVVVHIHRSSRQICNRIASRHDKFDVLEFVLYGLDFGCVVK